MPWIHTQYWIGKGSLVFQVRFKQQNLLKSDVSKVKQVHPMVHTICQPPLNWTPLHRTPLDRKLQLQSQDVSFSLPVSGQLLVGRHFRWSMQDQGPFLKRIMQSCSIVHPPPHAQATPQATPTAVVGHWYLERLSQEGADSLLLQKIK